MLALVTFSSHCFSRLFLFLFISSLLVGNLLCPDYSAEWNGGLQEKLASVLDLTRPLITALTSRWLTGLMMLIQKEVSRGKRSILLFLSFSSFCPVLAHWSHLIFWHIWHFYTVILSFSIPTFIHNFQFDCFTLPLPVTHAIPLSLCYT